MSPRTPTLHAEIERLEAQLASLERAGVLTDAPLPSHSRHITSDGIERFQVDGAAAMRNGIYLIYLRDFGISRPAKGPVVVEDEYRSFSAVLQGGEVILRYDSGHISHSQRPHVHADWPKRLALAIPELRIELPVDLSDFVVSIEAWRERHLHMLPPNPPELRRVRRR